MAVSAIQASAAQIARFEQNMTSAVAAPPPVQGPQHGFGVMLEDALTSVNQTQLDARGAVSALASGESVDLHGTMIRLEKADITLRAMTSVRDRVIGAYEQVMNMAL